MSIKWCAFTAALMIAFAVFTFQQKAVLQDPPGVTTRWWDGTTQSVETLYPDGKRQSLTIFGDDGTTVNALGEWTPEGVLVHTKIRQDDGTVEEKLFEQDGKTLQGYTLWNGDERTMRIQREYYSGKLTSEVIYNEEGSFPKLTRRFDFDGQLQQEIRLLDNADQQTDHYRDGKLYSTFIFKANTDRVNISYYAPGGPMYNKYTDVALDHSQIQEYFAQNGQILWRREVAGDGQLGTFVISAFENGVLKLKQTFSASQLLVVEEFSPSGQPVRSLLLRSGRTVTDVKRFRDDGTLETIKHLDNGRVVKQTTYDASGKDVVEQKDGGDAENIDSKLLSQAPTPRRGGVQ
jgi:antitoxin component YwqK of YwqJK toxin-antitoxin module